MSWSSISYSNGAMPTDLVTSSSSSNSSNGIGVVGGDPIPTLIGQGNSNNSNSNDRMSMESVSSLSSTHSLLPYSTMLASSTNSITMTRYGDNNNTASARSESETPKQPLPPRHRSVSVSGVKSAFVPPPPHFQTASASASPNLMMSTPSFASRALQPIENRMEGPSGQGQGQGQVNAAAGAPDGFDFLKSPTTLTFERMIEACTYETA
jgi:hypothetical protein